ncbi:hypothetical protein D3C75_989660 [compost metagenome]
MTEASCRSSVCRSSTRCRSCSSRGVMPRRLLSAAPVPAASPMTAQVAITRVVPKATWEALISRPAISIFRTLAEYRERKGM